MSGTWQLVDFLLWCKDTACVRSPVGSHFALSDRAAFHAAALGVMFVLRLI